MKINFGKVCAIVGGQWGDEGKGKLVDILAEKYDVIVRATGGANAGHTIYRELRPVLRASRRELHTAKFVFHLVPSAMFHPRKICVMGNGMVVHLPTLLEEIDVLKKAGVKIGERLKLSDRSHLVFDYHKLIDRLQEESKGGAKVGTTGRGIGPAYADKTSRIGIRAGELLNFAKFEKHYRAALEQLKRMYNFSHDAQSELNALKKIIPKIAPFIADTSLLLADNLKKKKTILLEGANGTLLDIDHGTYPYVTSSNASIGGLVSGSGIPPQHISSVIGIMKAYITRVGSGPFPTELTDELGERIRKTGNEFGATTGRPRRCGWFDAVSARYAMRINDFTAINLTKLDVLTGLSKLKIAVAYRYKGKRLTEFPFDSEVLAECVGEYRELSGWSENISRCRRFKDLPENCRRYVLLLEKLIGAPIVFIGTGKTSKEMIEVSRSERK